MTGIETAGLIRAGIPALKKAYGELAGEFARALSGEPNANEIASLRSEITEALEVLAGQSDTAMKDLVRNLRGAISRPASFEDPHTQAWIRTREAQEHLTNAALALIRGDPSTPHLEAALKQYEVVSGQAADHVAEHAVEASLDYIQVSLRRKMTVGDKVTLNALQGIQQQLGILQGERTISTDPEIIDQSIERELRHLRRVRFYAPAGLFDDVRQFGDTLLGSGKRRDGSPLMRAVGLAWCARLLLRETDGKRDLYLTTSKQLAQTEEALIADALVKGLSDKDAALSGLAPRSSKAQATAALAIACSEKGAQQGLEWFEAAGLAPDDLDSDGRYILNANRLEVDRWDDVVADVALLQEADFAETPALLQLAAVALTAAGLPAAVAAALKAGVPFDPSGFPLKEDKVSLDRRRVATRLMQTAAHSCRQLGLRRHADLAERYSLWLELRDPDTREAALLHLNSKLDDRESAVGYLPLGLAFRSSIDRIAANRGLEQYLALKPAGDSDYAIARLTFAISEETAAAAAAEFERHRDVLYKFLDTGALLNIEVELLTKSGRADVARERLSATSADDVEAPLRAFLEKVIEGGESGPETGALEESYNSSQSLQLLDQLVTRYQRQGFSDRYFELARELVQKSGNAKEAERIVRFLIASKRSDLAERLLDENESLVEASPDLLLHKAWFALHAGRIDQAETLLTALEQIRNDPDQRQLRFSLLVIAGRWPELSAFIEAEWANRDNLPPIELIKLADLASKTGSPRVREIIEAAVKRAPEDPRILAGAYMIASSSGIEEIIPEAHLWLLNAAESSGEDGPIKKQSLDELIERRPDWEKHVEDIWRQFRTAVMPSSIAAIGLRRPWLELQLVPMLLNPEEPDVRARSVVPLFAGVAKSENFQIDDQQSEIGIDRTALVTLAALELLEATLDTFDVVRIPHGTLAELFDEQERLVFHQPSRVAFSKELLRLLTRGDVQRFIPAGRSDASLANEIGTQLAEMLGEASSEPEGQHIVVHPFPVTRVGSMLRDPVDLSRFDGHLCSCSAVVDKLVRSGLLPARELERARQYLDRNDRRWPSEPEIEDGATLYLSDLSVDYLRYVGVLGKLAAAGLKVVISRTEASDAEHLIEHERTTDRVKNFIDDLRSQLVKGLASGKVRLDRTKSGIHGEDLNPSLGVAWLAESSPAIICDDRAINRYENFEAGGTIAKIYSTLDVLDYLRRSGSLDDEGYFVARTSLRRMGAIFVLPSVEELRFHLNTARIVDGKLVETAELRAIRENLGLAQLRGWLQHPLEVPWVQGLLSALTDAIIDQWRDGTSLKDARARSEWLLSMSDIRDWLTDTSPWPIELATNGLGLSLARLVTKAHDVPASVSADFSAWIEEILEEEVQAQEPTTYAWLIRYLRDLALSLNKDTQVEEAPDA